VKRKLRHSHLSVSTCTAARRIALALLPSAAELQKTLF
jgi:hypothetical protein